MDLLIEKNGKRTYLSQYKMLVTKFEEGAPVVSRNTKQIQSRNGMIDFGGWHTTKDIEVEGMYKADSIQDETALRERLFALLGDSDGYYITEMQGKLVPYFERPGENSGSAYEHGNTLPSHKRFKVYAKSLDFELQGATTDGVLYKMSATFETIGLPYGESTPRDFELDPSVPTVYRENKALGTAYPIVIVGQNSQNQAFVSYAMDGAIPAGTHLFITFDIRSTDGIGTFTMQSDGRDPGANWQTMYKDVIVKGTQHITREFTAAGNILHLYPRFDYAIGTITISNLIISTQFSPWNPNPKDPGYAEWIAERNHNASNLLIPYRGSVKCSQLEQGFVVRFRAEAAAQVLNINFNGKLFQYIKPVAVNDVFELSGYEYTKNGVSVVRDTNKAFFELLPHTTNRIQVNIPGTMKIYNLVDLYA